MMSPRYERITRDRLEVDATTRPNRLASYGSEYETPLGILKGSRYKTMTLPRHRISGELVTFKDAQQFHHDGILYESLGSRATVVHVHGSHGNFYQNSFLRSMAGAFTRGGVNLLSFNLEGHDSLAEGYRNEWDFEYVGGALSHFEKCVVDIASALEFAAQFSERVILQGHSLGCDRVLHYLLSTGASHECIFLSPCDSYRLQSNWIYPETVEGQIARLKSTPDTPGQLNWVPAREYGIGQRDWAYSIPMTRAALLSVLTGPPLQLLRLDRPARFALSSRAFLYIGGDDALQVDGREAMTEYLRERCSRLTSCSLYPEGDHSLWGCEEEVSSEILTWILSA